MEGQTAASVPGKNTFSWGVFFDCKGTSIQNERGTTKDTRKEFFHLEILMHFC